MTEAQTDEGRMTLVEHLTELRRRVIVSAVVLVVFTIVVFVFYSHLLHFLPAIRRRHPRQDGLRREERERRLQAHRHRSARAAAGAGQGVDLRRHRAVGAVRLLADLALRHARAAQERAPLRRRLPDRDRGAVRARRVAWFTVEKALEFLLGAGGSSIQPFITADKYLTLVTLMIAAFGVAFEFPVLLVFLLLVRVVNTRQLRNIRRWMIVGIVTFAAVITPSSDPFSLFFMAVPMYLFYEIAIVIGRVMKR